MILSCYVVLADPNMITVVQQEQSCPPTGKQLSENVPGYFLSAKDFRTLLVIPRLFPQIHWGQTIAFGWRLTAYMLIGRWNAEQQAGYLNHLHCCS